MVGESQPTLIQSVQRALRLIEAVQELGGRAQAKELARRSSLSLSTTYHLLRTLTHEGYLSRLDDGSYVMGPSFAQVTSQNQMAGTLARTRPTLQGLRDQLRSPVYLALYIDGEIAVVEICDSPKVPSIDLWVGIHDSAHATALGKCILSLLDDEDRADYLSRHPLHELTQRTVTDRRRLEHELGNTVGIAKDEEEYLLGVHCLATPVVTPDIVGAVAVARSRGANGLPPDAAVSHALVRGAHRIVRSMAVPVAI